MGYRDDVAMEDFASEGLYYLVAQVVCKACKTSSCVPDVMSPEVKGVCPGLALIDHVEGQIKRAGIEFMKQLVHEWRS